MTDSVEKTAPNGWAYRIAFSAFVAAAMSVLIGAAITFVQVAPGDRLSAWMQTAPLAFSAAFPTSLIVVPVIQRLLDVAFAIISPDMKSSKT
jgi:formate/nitrite transporter FocA (FNT family)